MRITRVMAGRLARTFLAGAVMLTLSGCLIAGSSSQQRTGNYVADTTFSQIEPGKTTAGWVLATLGEPDKKTKVDGDGEVWQWRYTEKRESSTAVFLIFGGSDKKETSGTAFVELKDGVVTNKWRG
jgi:outer membrane protein assembly factor BamE (lipoprotein component of BamABCDE complex)